MVAKEKEESRAERSIAFMVIYTVFGWDSFELRIVSLPNVGYQ
jgi:hypothetical protein